MENQNPLDIKKIKELLKTKTDGSLYKRESTTLEFKADFDWDSKASRVKYLKSIAAFSNKQGGYMVFGVTDSPRRLQGISKPFMEIDDAQISQVINEHLSPSPTYEREEFELDGKKFGVIYIHPAERKPIVCIKDYDKIVRDSTIYYRYSGQSCIIKSGDLIHLLNEAKQQETDRWMQFFTKASTIGIHNVGVYDSSSGKISTQKGNSFILDEALLKRMKVLDTYSVQEDGAEAVKIVGEIDKTGAVINRPFAIHDDDIINSFLSNENIITPKEYIEGMCYQSSGFMPIYFYIKKANISINQALSVLEKVKTRSQAKKRLIKRLKNDSKLENIGDKLPLDDTTSVRSKRKKYHNQLINNEEIEYKSEGELKRLLDAICNLKEGSYDSQYVKSILLEAYQDYYVSKLSSYIRKCICYIDLIENK